MLFDVSVNSIVVVVVVVVVRALASENVGVRVDMRRLHFRSRSLHYFVNCKDREAFS